MRIVIDKRPVVYNVSTSAAITQCIVCGTIGITGLIMLYLIMKEA